MRLKGWGLCLMAMMLSSCAEESWSEPQATAAAPAMAESVSAVGAAGSCEPGIVEAYVATVEDGCGALPMILEHARRVVQTWSVSRGQFEQCLNGLNSFLKKYPKMKCSILGVEIQDDDVEELQSTIKGYLEAFDELAGYRSA